jgi:trigger factor
MNRENPTEIVGLYDELLQKKSEDRFVIERSYPADAPKKAWAGKKIAHQIEIKAVFELKKPQMDEEFIRSLGLKDTEEFKRKLKEDFQHHQEHRRDDKIMEGIFATLLAAIHFPVPRSLQEQEVASRLAQNRQPLNFKDDGEKAKFKELIFAQAEKSVRLSLILDKMRRQFKIAVVAQDLDKEYAHQAQHHQLPEKEIRKYYGEEKKAAELKDRLLQAKINDFLKEKIKVKEV